MTSPISIECPRCKAKLKLKNQKAAGRKLPCPKCKRPFVVQLQPEPQEEAGITSLLDSLDDNSAAPQGEFAAGGLPPVSRHLSPSKKKSRAKQSKSAAWQRPALIAAVPEDRSRFGRQVPMGRQSSEAASKLQETMKEAVKGFCLGLTLTDGIELEFQFDCMDSSQAEKFKTDLDAALEETLSEGRQKLAEAKKVAPQASPLWGEILDLTEHVIDSIQAEQKSTTVTVHAAVPSSAGSTLAKVPQAISEAFARAPFGSPGSQGETTVIGNGALAMPEEPEPTPLKSVGLEQYHAAWQIDIDVSDQPAGEVLQMLSEELGLTLETPAAETASLAKTVSVKLAQKSRLEVVEEVCRQAGLVPVYSPSIDPSQPASLRLQPGPRRSPVTFAGPFLIEVTGIDDNAPYPTGTLTFRLYAAGLPEEVLTAIRESDRTTHNMGTCEEITDPQGRDLVDPGLSMSWSSSPDSSSVYEHSRSIPLKNLLRSVTAIKTLRGNVQFRLPTNLETIRFDKLEAKASRTAGNLTLTIRQENITSHYSSLTLEMEGVPDGFQYNDIKFEFADSEGRLMRGSVGGGGGSRGKWSITTSVQGQPASVTAKLITQVEDVHYEFQLDDIPFESHAKMPEKLAPPAGFSGHEGPISLQFVKIVPDANSPNFPPKARFRVVNHADKKIQRLDMKFEYLDSSGKVVKDWPMASHSGLRAMPQDGPGVVVAEKATAEFDANAPFLPKETNTVKATVKKVRFVDAEEWTPEGRQ